VFEFEVFYSTSKITLFLWESVFYYTTLSYFNFLFRDNRLINMNKTRVWYQLILFIYKNKQKYIYIPLFAVVYTCGDAK